MSRFRRITVALLLCIGIVMIGASANAAEAGQGCNGGYNMGDHQHYVSGHIVADTWQYYGASGLMSCWTAHDEYGRASNFTVQRDNRSGSLVQQFNGVYAVGGSNSLTSGEVDISIWMRDSWVKINLLR